MSIRIHSDYYQDNLEKRHCNNCIKTFIVGEELSKTVPVIRCPYCSSENNEAVTWSNEEILDDLGCLGIYFHKNKKDYYSRCVLCRGVLTKDNLKHENLCKDCGNKTRKKGAK